MIFIPVSPGGISLAHEIAQCDHQLVAGLLAARSICFRIVEHKDFSIGLVESGEWTG